jgi:hypothetical protein
LVMRASTACIAVRVSAWGAKAFRSEPFLPYETLFSATVWAFSVAIRLARMAE